MITIVRTIPFPRCKYCGDRMDYYIFGMSDDKHAHPGCRGIAMANNAIDGLKLKLIKHITKE